jgi:hypothetical protein
MVEHHIPAAVVWLFTGFVALHGAIHLLGVVKGFGLADVDQLTSHISTLAAGFWLLATVAFGLAAVGYLVESSAWWVAGGVGIVVSQALIFTTWQDAWVGTIPNVVILVGCVLGLGAWQFNSMVEQELSQFRVGQQAASSPIEPEALESLPEPVRRWASYTGVVGQKRAMEVKLHQTGRMKTDPDGDWMPVEADQWIRVADPGYLWVASVEAAPMIYLSGRDRYIDGSGEMLISLLSLIPVANSSGPEIDQGSLVRFMAEMLWYPGAALQHYIEWSAVDEHSARATMTFGDVEATGLFEFDEQGRVVRFSADRYYDRPEGATKERWVVNVDAKSYRKMGGLNVPTTASVTWKLKKEFTWYELQVTNLSRLEEELFQ